MKAQLRTWGDKMTINAELLEVTWLLFLAKMARAAIESDLSWEEENLPKKVHFSTFTKLRQFCKICHKLRGKGSDLGIWFKIIKQQGQTITFKCKIHTRISVRHRPTIGCNQGQNLELKHSSPLLLRLFRKVTLIWHQIGKRRFKDLAALKLYRQPWTLQQLFPNQTPFLK